MDVQTVLHTFSDNTKYVCTLTILGLFLIIILIISPLNIIGWILNMGKLVIILLLGYALYYNFNETHSFLKSVEGIFDNPELIGIRNNMLLSHIFSLFILILIIYVVVTIFK